MSRPATARRRPRPRPVATVVVGTVVGLGVAVPTGLPVWRPALVGAAGGLLVVAATGLVALARAEWSGRSPAGRRYLTVLLLLTGALILVAIASTGR